MTVRFRRPLGALILALFIFSCKPKEGLPDNFDYGRVENGVYLNSYFDFEVPLPQNWIVRNRAEMERVYEQGHQAVLQKNRQLANQLEASKINRATLLTLFKERTDSVSNAAAPNASFSIMVENLASHPNFRTGRDYLAQAVQLMKQSKMDYSFSPGFTSEQMGNKLFDRMDLDLLHNGVQVHQTYYVCIERRFALCILLSYVAPADGQELKDIAAKINFS